MNSDFLKMESVFIVAELSSNHVQNLQVARETLYAAKEAGADAIKIQTFKPDTITIDCDSSYFKLYGKFSRFRNLYDLFKKSFIPWEWHYELKELSEKLGLIFFSTPFDRTAVDFLESLDVPMYKIASFEITDIPLIEYVASKGKPVFISTGIATLCDICEAVEACRRMGNDQFILMKCVSSYPTLPEEVNLRTIPHMAQMFDCVVGISDHTLGISVPIAAVALGAKVVEKHIVLSRSIDSPDSEFSLTPDEFANMVRSIREVEKALGRVNYELTASMRDNRIFARSLFVVKDVKAGEVLTEENVRSIRPGYGLHPKYLKDILGRRAKKEIKKGTPLRWDLIE